MLWVAGAGDALVSWPVKGEVLPWSWEASPWQQGVGGAGAYLALLVLLDGHHQSLCQPSLEGDKWPQGRLLP